MPERQEEPKETVLPGTIRVPKLQSVAEISIPGRKSQPHHVALSLPLSPEVSDICEELVKVTVLSLMNSFVNESSILEVMPSIINLALLRPITPLNNCMFLVPWTNREEVKEVCKLGQFKVVTKDDP